MRTTLLDTFQALRSSGKKAFAVLLDPDHVSVSEVPMLVARMEAASVDFILVGGSLIINRNIHELVPAFKSLTDIPIVLFPGSLTQIVETADGILFLSLISGRNPELLIGQHVLAAPLLRKTELEIMPTGYMLIESGKSTTAHYISNTTPIPHDKPDIALCTAMAGEMLGLKYIYMDGGSGAEKCISEEMIQQVSRHVALPLIIGGGIREGATARKIWQAGADVVVIGNAFEQDKDGDLMQEIARVKRQLNEEIRLKTN
ncbi:MAG: geranylgeranylglyceryl/heptaprenylglyceryl phosphate synthase [Bacteroidota bacterium]